MKGKTKEAIIAYLSTKQEGWVKARQISLGLAISERNIRRHIAEINQEDSEKLILSSRNGYRLNTNRYEAYLKKRSEKRALPDSKEERSDFLLKKLLNHTEAPLNIYDIAEELFVSDSTIRQDLVQLRSYLAEKKLTLKIQKDFFFLEGKEQAKRSLLVHLIYDESQITENLQERIQEVLGFIPITFLERTIENTLIKRELFINQYSLDNIILHFAVTIQRIYEGQTLQVKQEKALIEGTLEQEIVQEITEVLSEKYLILFGEAEIYQLAILFIGAISFKGGGGTSERRVNDYVDATTQIAVKQALEKVAENYYIDLNEEGFLIKFIMHVQNLVYRSATGRTVRNPLINELKVNYPLIYDISVFIANELQKQLPIAVNEEEIAYIALHLGTFLESKKTSEKRIRTLIYSPRYYDVQQSLVKKIQQLYGEYLSIEDVVTTTKPIVTNKVDLIIATDPCEQLTLQPIVKIHHFLTLEDQEKIIVMIRKILMHKKSQILSRHIDLFFHPQTFAIVEKPLTKAAALKKMVASLMAEGFVQKGFLEDVLKREELSSTGFPSGVAIPHTMKMTAEKTSISILITSEGIDWCGEIVKLVVLIAIKPEDADVFSELFEVLVEALTEQANVNFLTTVTNYEEFIQRMKRLLVNEYHFYS